MATRSIVSVGGSKGMYIHFDGDCVGEEIQKILNRDGDKAIPILMGHEWSFINSDTTEDEDKSGNVTVIPNYGGIFNDTTPVLTQVKDNIWIEYVHTIDLDTMKVTTKPNPFIKTPLQPLYRGI